MFHLIDGSNWYPKVCDLPCGVMVCISMADLEVDTVEHMLAHTQVTFGTTDHACCQAKVQNFEAPTRSLALVEAQESGTMKESHSRKKREEVQCKSQHDDMMDVLCRLINAMQ